MYSLKERKTISRQIADPRKIDIYRQMLSRYRCKLSGTIIRDRRQLAETLVYALLGYCSVGDIVAACITSTATATEPVSESPSNARRQPEQRRTRNKFDEYPAIRWKNLDNPVIRTADSIYSDRIRCWSRLKELEQQMEDETDRSLIAEYVDLSVRLELCFDELRSLNDKGDFLGLHPFITMKSEKERIDELLRTDPEKYFEERKNVEMNIARYSSYLKSPKYDEPKKKKFREFLEKFQAMLNLYKDRLAESMKNMRT